MIYLIRHASPQVDYSRCGAALAKVRLDEYNHTALIEEDEISGFLNRAQLSQPLLSAEATILSSPVNRAYATACRLFGEERVQRDNRLHEYDLRLSAIPLVTMGLRQWFALHRVAWLLGISLGAVSRKAEYRRAATFADELHVASTEAGKTVVVVSHGMFLRTVRKRLQRQGMQAQTVYRSGCFTVEALTP
ncbi:MAG: histidine phosphatase family protein [Pseudomonas alloputida]